MPLFLNKFTPKKLPRRKKDSENTNNCSLLAEKEIEPILLNLGSSKAVFEQGVWIPDSNEGGHQEILELRESLKDIEEQNYLLNLKNELLLHMITKSELLNRQYKKEIVELKKAIKNFSIQVKGK